MFSREENNFIIQLHSIKYNTFQTLMQYNKNKINILRILSITYIMYKDCHNRRGVRLKLHFIGPKKHHAVRVER